MEDISESEKLKFSNLLLNEVNLIVVSSDSNGNITYVSPASEKIIGYKSETLLGNNWWNLTYFDNVEAANFKKKVCSIASGKSKLSIRPYARKVRCKDGSLKWVEWYDTAGGNNSFISVGIDITYWKKKEAKKIQSDTILKNVESMVLVSDKKGNVLYASPSVTKMLEYPLEAIMGDNWWKVTYKNEKDAERIKEAIIDYVFNKQKSFFDIFKQKIKTKTGNFKWIEWQLSKGVNDTYISIGTDITNRILTEIELKKAKEAAEKSLKVKNEFLANMSHEIRTPLNAVIGFTDLLLESELTTEQREQLETMRNSGEILLSLINNVLDLSKLESNKLEIENIEFNLRKHVNEVVRLMKIKASEKNIGLSVEFSPDVPQQVIGDSARLGQILLNLIGNAIKFTNEGAVSVIVKQKNETANATDLYIQIKDTGIGIVSNKINTVFGAFTQANSDTSRIYGGTGLGLTIVKKLVNLLNGNIKVESQFGKGTVFKMTIPYKKGVVTTSKVNKEQDRISYQPLGLNILLVEDNKTNQLLAKTRLERWDCSVDIANNGIEGVKKTQQKMYDVILMDIQMPVMDGYEATKIIKNDISEQVSKIPVIAMTAYANNADIKRARNSGMDDYIFKPFKPNELYDLLEKYGKINKILETNVIASEQTEEISNVVEMKYVDLTFVRKETLDESSVIKLLIELFIADFEEFLTIAEKELKHKNWKTLYEATHKIKPSVSMFGIAKMEPIIFSLVNKFREEKDLDDVEQQVDSCNKIFAHVKKELITELKSLNDE